MKESWMKKKKHSQIRNMYFSVQWYENDCITLNFYFSDVKQACVLQNWHSGKNKSKIFYDIFFNMAKNHHNV